MTRQDMIDMYLEQYVHNNPDEDEREMRKELRCMTDDELVEEFTNYCLWIWLHLNKSKHLLYQTQSKLLKALYLLVLS